MNLFARFVALLLYPFAVVAVELRRMLVDRELARLPAEVEEPPPAVTLSAAHVTSVGMRETVTLEWSNGKIDVVESLNVGGWYVNGLFYLASSDVPRDMLHLHTVAMQYHRMKKPNPHVTPRRPEASIAN